MTEEDRIRAEIAEVNAEIAKHVENIRALNLSILATVVMTLAVTSALISGNEYLAWLAIGFEAYLLIVVGPAVDRFLKT